MLLSTGAEEINALESLDGKTVYFANNHDKSTLKQIALTAQPGAESTVVGLPQIKVAELWTLSPADVYFVPAEAPKSLLYFDFATRHVRHIFEVDKGFLSGLSISPDGRWIIYSQSGDASGDIMLVNQYH